MKIILFIIWLFVPCALKAQTCLNRVDLQTGKTIRSGTTEMVVDSTLISARFTMIKIDSALSVGLTVVSPLATNSFDVSTMQLKITYVNGQIKTFAANNNTNIATIPNGTAVIFEASITGDDLNYIHDNPISQITLRFAGQDGPSATISVPQLTANQIINSILCLNTSE